jgi:hypothetical protein
MMRNQDRFEEGYDSDGMCGPFSTLLEEEGPQMFDEDAAPNHQPIPPEGLFTDDTTGENTKLVVAGATGHVPIDVAALNKMTRTELLVELKKRGQMMKGKKVGELLDRLQKALDTKIAVLKPGKKKVTAPAKKTTKTGDNLNGFAAGSYWEPLIAITVPIDEPDNPTFMKARAPTVPEEEADVVKLKYDFAEKFDHLPEHLGANSCSIKMEKRLKMRRESQSESRCLGIK